MNYGNLNAYIKNKDEATLTIVNRLLSYGIKLGDFDIQIIKSWKENPKGFNFSLKNPRLLSGVIAANPRFGRTNKVVGFNDIRKEYDIAFREISQSDSLHIQLACSPNAVCNIHLDSISIVTGKDTYGNVIYRFPTTILKHYLIDEKHIDESYLPSGDVYFPMNSKE